MGIPKRNWALTALCLGISLFADNATAHLNYRPETTDEGYRYIVVSGSFEPNDDLNEFRRAIASHKADSVGFNSPGGNVAKAIELGRIIRSLNLMTMAVRSEECSSACSLAFLGGTSRYAEPGSIGVHKSSFTDTKGMRIEEAVSAVQQVTADVLSYIIEMGADPGLLQLSLQYDSDDIRYLSASEMARYRVTTASIPAKESQLTSSTLTQTEEPVAEDPHRIPPPSSNVSALLQIPTAQRGVIQHPEGTAPLKASADTNSKTIGNFTNGSALEIVRSKGEWYQVLIGNRKGYMHDSWIWVREFEENRFGKRYLQIKIFSDLEAARSFALNSKIPMAVHLMANSWFAVTIEGAYSKESLEQILLPPLREHGTIPKDAFVTFGNTYVREVCCGTASSQK